jgi:hypothetical protein
MNDILKRTWQRLTVAHLRAMSDIYLEEVKRTSKLSKWSSGTHLNPEHLECEETITSV